MIGRVSLVDLLTLLLLRGSFGTCPSPAQSGSQVYHLPPSYSFKDQRRRFSVHAPPGYRHRTPTPVVLLLHGSGGNEGRILEATGFKELSQREGFLLVVGEGVTDGWPERKRESRSWNSGLCCSTPWVYDVDDVGYIKALLSVVHSRYCTSPRDVFVAGHANGGMMAYRMACQLSDHVTGIAVSAASLVQRDYRACLRSCGPRDQGRAAQCFDGAACTPNNISELKEQFPCLMSRFVSILHVHGELDPRIPYHGGIGLKHLGNASFLPVETLISHFVRMYSCSSEPTLTLMKTNHEGERTVLCEAFLHCSHARVEFCKLPLGGHHVPGSPMPDFCVKSSDDYNPVWCKLMNEKLGPLSNDISFAEKSWEFFKSISRKFGVVSKEPRSAHSKSTSVTLASSALPFYAIIHWILIF